MASTIAYNAVAVLQRLPFREGMSDLEFFVPSGQPEHQEVLPDDRFVDRETLCRQSSIIQSCGKHVGGLGHHATTKHMKRNEFSRRK